MPRTVTGPRHRRYAAGSASIVQILVKARPGKKPRYTAGVLDGEA